MRMHYLLFMAIHPAAVAVVIVAKPEPGRPGVFHSVAQLLHLVIETTSRHFTGTVAMLLELSWRARVTSLCAEPVPHQGTPCTSCHRTWRHGRAAECCWHTAKVEPLPMRAKHDD